MADWHFWNDSPWLWYFMDHLTPNSLLQTIGSYLLFFASSFVHKIVTYYNDRKCYIRLYLCDINTLTGPKFCSFGRQGKRGKENSQAKSFNKKLILSQTPRPPAKNLFLLGLTRRELLSNKRVSFCLWLLTFVTSWQEFLCRWGLWVPYSVQATQLGRGFSPYRAFHTVTLPQLYSLWSNSYVERSFIFYWVVVMWLNIEFWGNPLFWIAKFIFLPKEQKNSYSFNQRKSKPMEVH